MRRLIQKSKVKSPNYTKGFSLLELLIVIALIGILVALGTVSYSQAQKKARDSRRESDMKAIQNASEQYYGDTNSNYPVAIGDLTALYLPSGWPKDPKSGAQYVPSSQTVTSYCVCALLEGTTTGGNSGPACAYGSGQYYCVSNLQ